MFLTFYHMTILCWHTAIKYRKSHGDNIFRLNVKTLRSDLFLTQEKKKNGTIFSINCVPGYLDIIMFSKYILMYMWLSG